MDAPTLARPAAGSGLRGSLESEPLRARVARARFCAGSAREARTEARVSVVAVPRCERPRRPLPAAGPPPTEGPSQAAVDAPFPGVLSSRQIAPLPGA